MEEFFSGYLYVGNNPINLVDPLGLMSEGAGGGCEDKNDITCYRVELPELTVYAGDLSWRSNVVSGTYFYDLHTTEGRDNFYQMLMDNPHLIDEVFKGDYSVAAQQLAMRASIHHGADVTVKTFAVAGVVIGATAATLGYAAGAIGAIAGGETTLGAVASQIVKDEIIDAAVDGISEATLGVPLSVVRGGVPGVRLSGKIAKEGYTTIYRAVSKAEVDDIADFGFRMKFGGYETGKLFAPTLQEATQFGKNNFGLDGIPNTIMKVKVPNSVMNSATKFTADGMNAISIPASQLYLLKAKPLNYSPWLR